MPAICRRGTAGSRARLVGHPLDRLADDLDLADHGILRLGVREEHFLAVGCVVRDGVDRLDRVREVSALVSS